MFCGKCGNELEENNPICKNCNTDNAPHETAELRKTIDMYHKVSETLGFVPSFRRKDNLFQALFVLLVTITAGIIGWIVGIPSKVQLETALYGVVLGLLVSGFISGFILMIFGLKRAIKSRLKR